MVDLVAHSRRADLFFDGVFVTLVRHRARSFEGGVTRIPVSSITAVRWRQATKAASGFLEFAAAGAGTLAVVFGRTHQDAFNALKTAVEQALAEHGGIEEQRRSLAADLNALASLKREQLLTPEEYSAAKQHVLGAIGPVAQDPASA